MEPQLRSSEFGELARGKYELCSNFPRNLVLCKVYQTQPFVPWLTPQHFWWMLQTLYAFSCVVIFASPHPLFHPHRFCCFAFCLQGAPHHLQPHNRIGCPGSFSYPLWWETPSENEEQLWFPTLVTDKCNVSRSHNNVNNYTLNRISKVSRLLKMYLKPFVCTSSTPVPLPETIAGLTFKSLKTGFLPVLLRMSSSVSPTWAFSLSTCYSVLTFFWSCLICAIRSWSLATVRPRLLLDSLLRHCNSLMKMVWPSTWGNWMFPAEVSVVKKLILNDAPIFPSSILLTFLMQLTWKGIWVSP